MKAFSVAVNSAPFNTIKDAFLVGNCITVGISVKVDSVTSNKIETNWLQPEM